MRFGTCKPFPGRKYSNYSLFFSIFPKFYLIFPLEIFLGNKGIVKDKLIQELVDNIPDVIYFKDKEGHLILVNKAHAVGLCLTPQKVIGKTDYNFFPKDQAQRMTQDDQRVMTSGQPLIDVIEMPAQPNGSKH